MPSFLKNKQKKQFNIGAWNMGLVGFSVSNHTKCFFALDNNYHESYESFLYFKTRLLILNFIYFKYGINCVPNGIFFFYFIISWRNNFISKLHNYIKVYVQCKGNKWWRGRLFETLKSIILKTFIFMFNFKNATSAAKK